MDATDVQRKFYVLLAEVDGPSNEYRDSLRLTLGDGYVHLPLEMGPCLEFLGTTPSILEFVAWEASAVRPWGDEDVTTELLKLGVIMVIDELSAPGPELGALLRVEVAGYCRPLADVQSDARLAGESDEAFLTDLVRGLRAGVTRLSWARG